MIRHIAFIILTLFSINSIAGIGGTSGGSGADAYTTEICHINEAGEQTGCRMIKFKAHDDSPFAGSSPAICSGEAQDSMCYNQETKVPELFNKINRWFEDQNYKARVDANSP